MELEYVAQSIVLVVVIVITFVCFYAWTVFKKRKRR